MIPYIAEHTDSTEPWHDTQAEILHNQQQYAVISGCGITADAGNMTIDIAAGTILHNGSEVSITGGTDAETLVSDGSNPRWTLVTAGSGDATQLVQGTAAATPAMPEHDDNVVLGAFLIPAGETLASNCTSLDWRTMSLLTTATPSTQAFGDAAVVGTGGTAARTDHKHAMPAAPLSLAGSQLTEGSMSSTTATDVVTVSSLSIAATVPFIVAGIARKTGTTDTAGLGLKLNSTVVEEASPTGGVNDLMGPFSNVESGAFFLYIPSRVTNYLRASARMTGQSAGGADDAFNMGTADMPTATITDVAIRGDMSGTTDTLFVDDVFVWTLPTS